LTSGKEQTRFRALILGKLVKPELHLTRRNRIIMALVIIDYFSPFNAYHCIFLILITGN